MYQLNTWALETELTIIKERVPKTPQTWYALDIKVG